MHDQTPASKPRFSLYQRVLHILHDDKTLYIARGLITAIYLKADEGGMAISYDVRWLYESHAPDRPSIVNMRQETIRHYETELRPCPEPDDSAA